jgi:uncharacterized protein (TIGR00251 family)
MKVMLNTTEFENGIRFEVKVQPKSSQNQIAGIADGVLKIKLTTPPVDGKANQALVNLLSKTLNVPKKNITIVRGQTSTSKLIQVIGLGAEALLNQLGLK